MGIAEEVLVYLKVKGTPDLKNLDQAMTRLGYNLRLAGRDLMRMGGQLDRVGQYFKGFAGNVFKSSDIMGDAFDDIQLAWQDVFEETGIIDSFAGAMEGLAEIIEANPILAWGAMALFVFGQIASSLGILFKLIGFMNLAVGATLSARSAGLGWAESIKYTIQALLLQNEAIKENIKKKALAAAETRKLGGASQQAGKKWKQSTLFQEKSEKESKKQKKGLKGLGKTLLFGISALSGLIVGMTLIGPIMEAVAPIFEAIGDAVTDVFDALEASGIIDWIVDFIENNKELVVAMLVAVAALPLLISGVKTLGPLLGKLGGKFKIVTDIFKGGGEAGETASGGFNKTLLAIAAILPSIVGLVWAFTEFIKVVSKAGFTISEIGVLLALMTANVGAIVTVVGVLSKFLSGLNQMGWGTVAMVAALMSGAVALALAFSHFLEVAAATGFNL